jgi:hypothetical protein
MSFIALQARHNACMNQLHDGTLGNADVFAFPSVLADNDTYFYGQAMNQPDRPNFIRAMVKEIDDLFQNDVWQLRHHSEVGDIQTIKTVWSFKRKRSPDGTVTKHKARLCAHGGMQLSGSCSSFHSYWGLSPGVLISPSPLHRLLLMCQPTWTYQLVSLLMATLRIMSWS